jgi:hypothetical protein
LQDIAPTVAKRWVTSAVRAPIRAAALAASQPACPPPMTTTSYELGSEFMRHLLYRDRQSQKRKRQFVSRETPMRTLKEMN